MVFVSEEVKQAFLEICPVRGKTKVLYNTNETDLIVSKAKEEIKEEIFLQNTFFWCGVGKIVQNKGFDKMPTYTKATVKRRIFNTLVDFRNWSAGRGIKKMVYRK